MNELETARALLDKQAASIKSLIERAEKAEAVVGAANDVSRFQSRSIDALTIRAEVAEAALATAETEIASLKQDVETYSAAHDAAAMLLRDSEDRLATARAVMAEEIARRFEELEPPTPRGYARQPVISVDDNEAAANFCRALAPLPAGLVVLPVQVVDDAKFAVMKGVGFLSERFGNNEGNDWADANAADVCDGLDETLTALSSLGGEADPEPEKPPCPECSDLPFRDPCSICDAPGGPR